MTRSRLPRLRFLLLALLCFGQAAKAGDRCAGIELSVPGPEDIAVLPDGRLLVSAYDRRDPIESAGAILLVDPVTAVAGVLPLTNPADLHPHGIALDRTTRPPTLAVINRRYGSGSRQTELRFIALHEDPAEQGHVSNAALCNANDIAALPQGGWVVTTDRRACRGLQRMLDDVSGHAGGAVWYLPADGGAPQRIAGEIGFANGIAVRERPDNGTDIFVAATRERTLHHYRFAGGQATLMARHPLPAAPDNLGWDGSGALLVAAHPNLLRLAAYRAGLPGFSTAPSAVYRVDPDDGRSALVFEDDGTRLSGATVAVALPDGMAIGSAYSTRLLICSEAAP